MPKTMFATGGANDKAILNRFYNFPEYVGNVIFVDSVTGSSSGPGFSPENAYATIVQAIAAATASNGDIILCLPGHTEAVIAAGTITASKAGVSVMGLGKGRQRPVITYTTAAAASVDVTAANVTFTNVVFKAVGVDAVTAAVNVSAADVGFYNCEFELADGTNQAVLGILTAATATRMVVEGCFFHGTGDAGTATAIRHAAGDDVIIRNNIFHGAYTTTLGGIDNSAAVKNLQIHNNSLNNLTAASAKCITCHASSTGQIRQNTMQVLTGTAPIAGAAMSWVGMNYYAATIATAGTLI